MAIEMSILRINMFDLNQPFRFLQHDPQPWSDASISRVPQDHNPRPPSIPFTIHTRLSHLTIHHLPHFPPS